MASELLNVVRFTGLAVGAPTSLPHGVNNNGAPLVPDFLSCGTGFSPTATSTLVTVTRGASDPADVSVLCWSLHSMPRVLPAGQANLTPQPFVLGGGSGGASGGGGYVTVATLGADYPTVAAAMAAGATKIRIVGDTVETGDIYAVQNFAIVIDGLASWVIGDHNVKMWMNANSPNVCTISSFGRIVWSPTTSKHLFDGHLIPFNADTQDNSPIVTNTTINTNLMRVGQQVNSGALTDPRTILSIDSPTQFTMSGDANSTNVGIGFNNNPTSFQLQTSNTFVLDGSGGTANDCHVVSGANTFISTGLFEFNIPNQHGWGFHAGDMQTLIFSGPLALVALAGVGNNCYDHFSASAILPELFMIGSYSDTQPAISPSGCNLGLVWILTFGQPVLNISFGGIFGGYRPGFAPLGVNLTILDDRTIIQNADFATGNVIVGNHQNVVLENVACNAVTGVNLSPGAATVFKNVRQTAGAFASDQGTSRTTLIRFVAKTFADSPYTPGDEESILGDASGGVLVINIPSAVTNPNRVFSVKKIDPSVNQVSIACFGAETLDGLNVYPLLAQYNAVEFYSDGAVYQAIAKV